VNHAYPLIDLGGTGQPMHIAVANGFPAQIYQPALAPLMSRYHLISLTPRPLWAAPGDPADVTSWEKLADDLLAGLRAHDLTDVIAVGHSLGAVASMLAALREPERFRALILLDPTFLPPNITTLLWFLKAFKRLDVVPLIRGTRLRRSRFKSIEEAYAYWRSKRLFNDWSDDTLRLYAENITLSDGNGGIELAWTPEWEASIYEAILTDWPQRLRTFSGRPPVLAIRGAHTDTFTRWSAAIFQSILPEATVKVIEGHGHLFPQSAPQATRQIIEAWLGEQRVESKKRESNSQKNVHLS
jgi:pimeloyl-ACP methyl ester carboxylesterase